MGKSEVKKITLISVLAVLAIAAVIISFLLMNQGSKTYMLGYVMQNEDGIELYVEPMAGTDIPYEQYCITLEGKGEHFIVDQKNKSISYNALPKGTMVKVYYNEKKSAGTAELDATKIIRIDDPSKI